MSAPQNFRSAFNGFNREDVVHYLEYLTAKHTAQVNQLTGEADYLRRQLEQVNAEQLEAQCVSLREQLEESLSIRKALEARCNGLEKELEEALAASRSAAPQPGCSQEEELEAYRRAERTERVAQERAQQIYDRANGILADAISHVDTAADRIGNLADGALSQLEQLCCAIGNSKQALKAAADAMYALRPQED